jgi:hypothetical protein
MSAAAVYLVRNHPARKIRVTTSSRITSQKSRYDVANEEYESQTPLRAAKSRLQR